MGAGASMLPAWLPAAMALGTCAASCCSSKRVVLPETRSAVLTLVAPWRVAPHASREPSAAARQVLARTQLRQDGRWSPAMSSSWVALWAASLWAASLWTALSSKAQPASAVALQAAAPAPPAAALRAWAPAARAAESGPTAQRTR